MSTGVEREQIEAVTGFRWVRNLFDHYPDEEPFCIYEEEIGPYKVKLKNAGKRIWCDDEQGCLVEIIRFNITESGAAMHNATEDWWRQVYPGRYTMLAIGGQTIMSDTHAEVADHMPAFREIAKPTTKRVLITGLGIGVVIKYALSMKHVEHVDVIERSGAVIELVGPSYNSDPRLNIVHADALRHDWIHPEDDPIDLHPAWDVVWHDIWPSLNFDNLATIQSLGHRYRPYCRWQGAWSLDEIIRKVRNEYW